MSSNRFVSSVVCLVVCGSALAGQSPLSQRLNAYYTKLDALTLKMDVAKLVKLLNENTTQDYTYSGKPDKNGRIATRTRQQTAQGLAEVMPHIEKFTKSVSHVIRISPVTDTCMVTVGNTIAWTTKLGPDGKAHKLTNDSVVQDTWVKVGKEWKIKASKNISGDITIDGKPRA